jgi:hypothetical protein
MRCEMTREVALCIFISVVEEEQMLEYDPSDGEC